MTLQTPINLPIMRQRIGHERILLVESRDVAKALDKRHDHLVRDIDTYVYHMENPPKETTSPNLGRLNPKEFFIESMYEDKKKEQRRCYLITKMGCEFLAGKTTGAKGTLFSVLYVKEFNRMQEQLAKQESEQWKNTRQEGKSYRRELTDTIKELVEYSVSKGVSPKKANQCYGRFTKIINNALGIKKAKDNHTRDYLDEKTLTYLKIFEDMAKRTIEDGLDLMEHDISKFCAMIEFRSFGLLEMLGLNIPTPQTPQLKERVKQLQLKQAT